MLLTVDTSAIMAVLINEQHKPVLIERTQGCDLIAPESLHWEIGNAFSAMLRRRRITIEQVHSALGSYSRIPIRFVDIELRTAVELAAQYDMYAYDAYMLCCAQKYRTPLLTLDGGLIMKARQAEVSVLEIEQ